VIVIEPAVVTAGLRKIGQEVSETLDYRPPKLVVIRRERPKYIDPMNEERGVIVAPLPPRPIEKGMAEPGLLATILIEKFIDHLPLYRQVQRFARQGITLAGSTLGDWTAASADLLVPLYDALISEALGSGYIQADETPIPVQDPEVKGKTHRGYYWVYHAPLKDLVIVEYERGRGRAGPAEWLKNYQGALQSDGYVVYEDFDRRPGITTYGCWAHARRYFFEALQSAQELAPHALQEIQLLYDVERELREIDPTPENRLRVRQERAVPVLDRFKAWLEENPGLPKSPWGKAVAYSLARWEKLLRYTGDGHIEIDNNLVENAIRPLALGRKNYLFAGSHDAAQRGAVIYSLLATCKKHNLDVQSWLCDTLGRIPTHPHKQVHELLPYHWKRRKV
jgi:transposase